VKRLFVFVFLAAGLAALADDTADRDKLAGSWQSPDGARWVLDSKADSVHIAEFDHDRKVAEFECNTLGRECAVKDAGKSAKVTMYFNGPKLVLLETRGSEVVKRRFHANGDQLEVETMPLVPQGKTETATLSRAVVAQK
jgi:hypothetical protein